LTWTSAACATGGVCVLVAKRARCCASGPRPLLRVPWARARGATRIDAPSQPHTCWWRRARPIFTASSRRRALLRVAGVLRGPRAAFRAMAMLDAAVHVLCAGLLRSRVGHLLCCSLPIRACATPKKRKDPHTADVWDSRSTHLQGGHQGNARQAANAGARRYTSMVDREVARQRRRLCTMGRQLYYYN
jgi:hypothetical protein